MRPERLTEIIADATTRGALMQSCAEGFRETAGRDPKAEARAEYEDYIGTIHGRRGPRAELQRIEREILHEREADWRRQMERSLGLLDYSHSQELPTLEANVRECEQPQTAAEMYEAAVSDRGSSDRPLMLALLEQVTRTGVRRELSPLPPSAGLTLYRQAISGEGITPDAVVRRAILIQEIERRSAWSYDAKGPNAAKEHAALLELSRLIAETKASRVPKELRAVIDAAREARKHADLLRLTLKLRPMTPDELFPAEGIDKRYSTHPAIQRAIKRKDERR